MRNLALSKNVVNLIGKLQAKQFKPVMGKILSLLADPAPPDSKQLKGFENLCRTDIGEFCIIYRFNEDTVAVSLVRKRNDDEACRQL
jgi:mRNA interferase RelE/StbE